MEGKSVSERIPFIMDYLEKVQDPIETKLGGVGSYEKIRDFQNSVGTIPSGPRAGQRLPINRATIADSIIKDLTGPSKLGMRRNMLRWGTAVPLAGLGIGLGQAGHAASQGDYAGAAAHTVGALVGEVPIIGDVAVESVTGSSVADGELAPNLAQVNESLKIGPEPVNLDPTGDEDFDAVAQPFLKMLQLK